MENLSYTTTRHPGLLRKIAGLAITIAMVCLALMFSALLFVAILTVGAIAWSYLWWNTRTLRKQMRNRPSGDDVIEGGEIIEGEAIRVADPESPGAYEKMH